MYKYSNQEQTAVTNIITGHSNITPSNWMWKEYQEWLSSGNTTSPYKSDEELLLEAKAIKNAEAEETYTAVCSAPVLTNGLLMKGGESSASTIKGALDRMVSKQKRDPSKNTVRLFDVYGQIHTVSFEEAEIIAEEIADAVEEALFALVQRKRAIAMATTIEELG